MGNHQVDNKFRWVIKNFCSLPHEIIYSDVFSIGGYKWHILAYPNGKTSNKSLFLRNNDNFCLDLELVHSQFLPYGWSRAVKFSFTIVNYLSKNFSKQIGLTQWFDQKERIKGLSMIPLCQLTGKHNGFLVDGEVEIVAQIHVFENERRLGVLPDDNMVPTFFKFTKPYEDSDLYKEDLVCVKGFQVLPSQVGIVRRIFETFPDTALLCCTKNQDLRTSYINVLFSLIKILYKGSQEHSTDDLSDAEAALAYMKIVGFNLDWLEKKVYEVKINKKKRARVSEFEQQLKDLMDKYTGVSNQLEKERAEIKEAAAPDVSFNDVL